MAFDGGGDALGELWRVAGDDPRAAERHELICPGAFLEIRIEGGEAHGKRPIRPAGAQAGIHLVEPPFAGEQGEGREEALAEAREVGADFGRGVARVVIEQDDVEVGAEGHLAPAEFAKGEYGEGDGSLGGAGGMRGREAGSQLPLKGGALECVCTFLLE